MVTEHQVRERAYYIWEGEGRHCGRAETHWLQAEAELHAPQAAVPAIEASKAKTRVAGKVASKSTTAKAAAIKTSEISPAKTLKPRAGKAKAAAEAPAAIRVKRAPRTRAETPALH